MKVGDILEWLAGAAFTASAYLATHAAWATLIVAGVALAYFAQCYASHAITRPNLRIPRVIVAARRALRRKAGE